MAMLNNQMVFEHQNLQQKTKALEEHWVEGLVTRHDPLEGTRPPRSHAQRVTRGELGPV